ncbi:hypothetical protein L3Q82_002324 [Scortum barcoo]|uniref:Uncharacterized protein n=1 Tax=Scortum barcoo TaxID=214431 RepID=A0ACB8VYA8_9TELE|nr:hypothetical protein L3Q82_002324 [Scortum barcoo]
MPSACDSLIEDIEDMVSSSDPTPHERQSARKSIIPRSRKNKELLSHEELQADSLIPGTQKIWMKTWGCSHNNSDGEYMAGQLAASGYKITEEESVFPIPKRSQPASQPAVIPGIPPAGIGNTLKGYNGNIMEGIPPFRTLWACSKTSTASPYFNLTRDEIGGQWKRKDDVVEIEAGMDGGQKTEITRERSVYDPTDADLWLLNSCTVKNPAEDHFRNSINLFIEKCPDLVVLLERYISWRPPVSYINSFHLV